VIEKTIIGHLLKDEGFTRKALPNLKKEYFQTGSPERVAFEIIDDYVRKYGQVPSHEALGIDLTNRRDLSQDLFEKTATFLGDVTAATEQVQARWLIDQTEQFCQDKALNIAIRKSLEIVQDSGEKGLSRGSIPKLLQDALAVTFDPHIGHDYLDDASIRYDEYHQRVKRIPFDLKKLNDATKGGLIPKTLNVVMAVSGAGKSLFMCHCAASNLMDGLNVLYITLELSQEMVGTRIDANLMDVDMDLLRSLPKEAYDRKVASIRAKTSGKLIIKEYSQAGAAHFRHLLNELKIKKNFVPDIIYIDYLNICVPTGRKSDAMNSYERVKTIAEELRAIAVDYVVPVVSATQTNRSGYGASDVGMENTSDSLGLPMTVDLFWGLIQTEQLSKLKQYKLVQLKSRYDDITRLRSFYIGVDKLHMRLYDVEEHAQVNHEDDEDSPRGQPAPVGARLSFREFK
jgi:KaiC/GvpD/RAD55 family RecA-like ATPase